jgi:hypothetical protein
MEFLKNWDRLYVGSPKLIRGFLALNSTGR